METRTQAKAWGMMCAGLALVPTEAFAQVAGLAPTLSLSWVTVTGVALLSAVVLGVGLRLGLKTLSALRLISPTNALRARAHARVFVGSLVLLALVFPYVVRQQPALALLLLFGMSMFAASGRASRKREGAGEARADHV